MHKFTARFAVSLLLLALLIAQASPLARAQGAGAAAAKADRQLLQELFRELIEINTVDPDGDMTRAAEAMAKHLRAAGFAPEDVRVLVPQGNPKKGNLVAHFRSP